MSVEITFQPIGLSGLVPEGTYLSDAARRMGVLLTLDCKGRGECTSCLVSVLAGAQLLSLPTQAERNILGGEGLSQQQRLACQVRLERSGELVVHVSPKKEKAESESTDPASMRKRFAELTLDKKISTLVQLEALTMFEAFNAMVDKPLAVGEKVFDRVFRKTKSTQEEKRKNQ
jgi:ferredoxin